MLEEALPGYVKSLMKIIRDANASLQEVQTQHLTRPPVRDQHSD